MRNAAGTRPPSSSGVSGSGQAAERFGALDLFGVSHRLGAV